ncbi:MAG: hypothetical protein IJ795_00175 [Bacteroidales bacterium]|nr:hypothetical protein [Bacteroidales bacterium]
MKKGLRISLIAAILLGTVALLCILARGMDKDWALKTCTGLDVCIVDSVSVSFIKPSEVKATLEKEYGVYLGKPLDSLNLKKIENILTGVGVISSAQAYITPDGLLHLEIGQREPALLFKAPDASYYADANGFIFPEHPGFKKPLPQVQGQIPLCVPAGFKGYPASESEKIWLENITGLAAILNSDPKWKGAFPKINVDKNGEIVLYPVKGKEKFIFGDPCSYKEKLAAIQKYYTHIAPAKEPGYYGSVNLKYDGQIICRTK